VRTCKRGCNRVQALVDKLRTLPEGVKIGVATLLAGIQETMFVTKSVADLTFNGYDDQFGDIIRQIAKLPFIPPQYRKMLEGFLASLPPRIGFFYGVCARTCASVHVSGTCSKMAHPTMPT
jgi:hypothetical protein